MLQTKLITMIDDTTKTYPMVSQAAVNSTSHTIAHICNRSGWTAYKLIKYDIMFQVFWLFLSSYPC